MILSGQEDLIDLVKIIAEMLNKEEFHSIWSRFSPYSFAIYNKEWVYLYSENNAPSGFITASGIYLGSWNENFVGNTAIQYDGQLIAIWDQSSIAPTTSFDELYSSIVHEMFHCHQEEKGIFRSGNELQLLLYPFTTQNIAARLEERKYLLRAVFAEHPEEKLSLVSAFIQLRELRREWIGEYLQYELVTESNEGTATYVEFKTRVSVSELPFAFLLAKFGRGLAEFPQDLKTLRASCYPSGMFIALLLDNYMPNWQVEYESTNESLYELLIRHVKVEKVSISSLDTHFADVLIEKDLLYREKAFQEFSQQKGYRIKLHGNFKVTGIDPMNMVRLENHILHHHFIKLSFNDKEFFLSGQTIARIKENLWTTDEVEFFTSTIPMVGGEQITLENFGNFSGSVDVADNHYIITVLE